MRYVYGFIIGMIVGGLFGHEIGYRDAQHVIAAHWYAVCLEDAKLKYPDKIPKWCGMQGGEMREDLGFVPNLLTRSTVDRTRPIASSAVIAGCVVKRTSWLA